MLINLSFVRRTKGSFLKVTLQRVSLAFGFSQRAHLTSGPSTSLKTNGSIQPVCLSVAHLVRPNSLFSTKLMLAFFVGLILFSGLMLFSHSAYAADISISSSGEFSFGEVQPSNTGTLVTGEDELSVSTTCSEGVSVYATSVNNSETGTSLINEAAKSLDTSGTNESAYTISTSTNTVGSGSATALANNTWGLNTNATEAGNNLYYGLPAYSASSLPPAIYTGALPAGTGDAYTGTIPVYYGAKITNTLVPGTYAGEVLYTVTVNTACLNYTVTFNKNAEGASGTMENQTILPAGGNLKENTFEYSGYTFLGWSTSPEGKTGTAVDGIGTEADVEYENEALFPDATTSPDIEPGDGVTLYAIWKINSHTVTILGASAPDCSATVHPTATTGCKMKDGRTWILGNNGNSITWDNMFTGATGTNNHDATVKSGICPSGYSAPKITDFDSLIIAYGGTARSSGRNGYRETTGALYSVLGLSGSRNFWSSTENSGNNAYRLYVNSSSSSSVNYSSKTNNNYVLCYK